jgi:hypothetical protein
VAAKCFNRGKNFHMEKIANAHQSALVASRWWLDFQSPVCSYEYDNERDHEFHIVM